MMCEHTARATLLIGVSIYKELWICSTVSSTSSTK